jgi:uncharacterized protein YciI
MGHFWLESDWSENVFPPVFMILRRVFMLYVIRCVDKENHLDVRMANRPTHVEYLKSFGERLFAAGPTLDAAGEMNGSVVILECEKPEQAEEFAANDPYAKADLFSSVTISPWKKVLP